ncbi:ATP-binding protein [Streptomyces sp.]|uniref:ATP-binding protein n=1 Tax=Streptomyces sp. TaxID=1931 RepID=UPI0025EE2811|nr:ATP-binding protein [Streptomyces sp.]
MRSSSSIWSTALPCRCSFESRREPEVARDDESGGAGHRGLIVGSGENDPCENGIPLGPPGIGRTHLAGGLGVKVVHAGYSVLFDTASNWIARLAAAHQAGRLEAEPKQIRPYKLIIIDEVGYLPFDQDAANLFFQFIASRYERGSVMVTSNLPSDAEERASPTTWSRPR